MTNGFMHPDMLIKYPNLERIAPEGDLIYQRIKHMYEKKNKGKYLAIEIESKKVYMADTGADAVMMAKRVHPDKVFYLVKIGFDAVAEFASPIFRTV